LEQPKNLAATKAGHHGHQPQAILSPQQLSQLNKTKLIEMVYRNYQNHSQLASSKRFKQAETGASITVLSGSSNNETQDEIMFLQSSQKKKRTKQRERDANRDQLKKNKMRQILDVKSAEITRRSQSGDGSKSVNNR
jgi:isocitrate dehydrogenase kinase/phosphatase